MCPTKSTSKADRHMEPGNVRSTSKDREPLFAADMKAKLAKKRAEGRGGWDRKGECTGEFLSFLLREHVEKGDPLDVGNLAMMLHQRGERIIPAPPTDDVDTCPVCAEPLKDDDTCATDIEMGICHAACLDGSPTVDLETGETTDGPIDTYRYGDTAPDATSPSGGDHE